MRNRYVSDSIENTASPPTSTSLSGSSSPSRGTSSTGLRGQMGAWGLLFTALAFNGPMVIVLGFVPTVVSSGNQLGAPLTFIAMGVLILLFAVGLNAMASRMAHAGAFYTYITAGLGRPTGLAAGFVALTAYFAISSGCYILVAQSLDDLLTGTFGLTSVPPWWLIALVAWALGTGLALFNVELSAKVLGTAVLCEITIALIWNVAVFVDGGPEGRSVPVVGEFFSGNVSFAFAFVILALTGFESLQVFRAESKDPSKTVPRATYMFVVGLAVLYAVSAYAYIVAVGPSHAVTLATDDPTGSILASLRDYVAVPFADIANILLVSSSFACALATHAVSARYIFALGKDSVLPSALGVPNPRHGSPMRASAASGLILLLVIGIPALAGAASAQAAYPVLLSVGGYFLIVLWVATSIAVIMFFRRNRMASRFELVKVQVASVVAAAGLGVIFLITTANFSAVMGGSPTVAYVVWAVLVVAVVGGVLWALALRRLSPSIYHAIHSQGEMAAEEPAG